jgi:hypothetical protein
MQNFLHNPAALDTSVLGYIVAVVHIITYDYHTYERRYEHVQLSVVASCGTVEQRQGTAFASCRPVSRSAANEIMPHGATSGWLNCCDCTEYPVHSA